MTESIEDICRAHIGRSREATDPMAPGPGRELQALLDHPPELAEGDTLPPTWHWAYLAEAVRQSELGADGHARLGRFLPPVPYPRRMWAAGDIAMFRPLRLGTPARCVSTIRDVTFKEGRSGRLAFVVVRHEISQGNTPCRREDQTLVYRERAPAGAPPRGPGDPVPEGFTLHEPVRLMRYSAVTRNPHRIHYDRDFAREVEGYPGLVVHGPLLATYLCEALRTGRAAAPARFTFRATAPVFEMTPIRVERGEDATTAGIRRADGVTAMTATMA